MMMMTARERWKLTVRMRPQLRRMVSTSLRMASPSGPSSVAVAEATRAIRPMGATTMMRSLVPWSRRLHRAVDF